MADIKVSQLPEATQINDEDLLMIVQGNTNKKITKANAKFASGDEIFVGDTLPSGEDADSIKLWLTDDDALEGEGNYISNEYGTSQEIGYSQEYVNNIHKYSTTKQRFGMLEDGTPTYRVILNFSTSSTTTNNSASIDISSLNVDEIIDCHGVATNRGLILLSDTQAITYTSSAITIYFNNQTAQSFTGHIILEYTETEEE